MLFVRLSTVFRKLSKNRQLRPDFQISEFRTEECEDTLNLIFFMILRQASIQDKSY